MTGTEAAAAAVAATAAVVKAAAAAVAAAVFGFCNISRLAAEVEAGGKTCLLAEGMPAAAAIVGICQWQQTTSRCCVMLAWHNAIV